MNEPDPPLIALVKALARRRARLDLQKPSAANDDDDKQDKAKKQ